MAYVKYMQNTVQLCYFEVTPETRDTSLLEYADHQLIVWLIAHFVKESIKQSIGGLHILTNWCPESRAWTRSSTAVQVHTTTVDAQKAGYGDVTKQLVLLMTVVILATPCSSFSSRRSHIPFFFAHYFGQKFTTIKIFSHPVCTATRLEKHPESIR